MEGGILTGRLREPLCIDGGKLVHARAVVRELGVELAACAFYTDDYGAVPLAEAVAETIIVNPDPRLRREAKRRGWPILAVAAPAERPGLATPIWEPARSSERRGRAVVRRPAAVKPAGNANVDPASPLDVGRPRGRDLVTPQLMGSRPSCSRWR